MVKGGVRRRRSRWNERRKGQLEIDLRPRTKRGELAKKRGADPGQVYASLQKAGRLKEIEHGLTEEKVFKWLLERNTVE